MPTQVKIPIVIEPSTERTGGKHTNLNLANKTKKNPHPSKNKSSAENFDILHVGSLNMVASVAITWLRAKPDISSN
jgi:hypothetical protein